MTRRLSPRDLEDAYNYATRSPCSRWLDAFFLLCSMAFAPYFWLIEEIIKRRRER